MSRPNRNDSAYVDFTVNVPPEVIREYFEGLAKVEAAKRAVPNKSTSTINWWNYVPPSLIQAVGQMLLEYLKTDQSTTSVRTPEPFLQNRCTGTAQTTSVRTSEPFLQNLSSQTRTSEESVPVKSEESTQSNDECEVNNVVDSVKVEETKETETSCTSTTKQESEKKPKRPSYEEGENVMRLNLGNLGSGLGGEEGLNEMMKMLGPMFQGLTSGLNAFGQTQGQTEVEKSSEVEEKKEESLIDLMGKKEEEHKD